MAKVFGAEGSGFVSEEKRLVFGKETEGERQICF